MPNVDSSWIKAVEYNYKYSELAIYTLSGWAYFYNKVPVELYEDLLNADSKGRFYNFAVKGLYDSVKSYENPPYIPEWTFDIVSKFRVSLITPPPNTEGDIVTNFRVSLITPPNTAGDIVTNFRVSII